MRYGTVSEPRPPLEAMKPNSWKWPYMRGEPCSPWLEMRSILPAVGGDHIWFSFMCIGYVVSYIFDSLASRLGKHSVSDVVEDVEMI